MNNSGFTLVETLVMIALVLVFSLAGISLFQIALISGTKAQTSLQAKLLAQEGMEAIIAIRNQGGSSWDWVDTPENTAEGEYYQPAIIDNDWQLGAKSSVIPISTLPTPYEQFTRTIRIESVQRTVGCGSSTCPIVLSGGTIDANTRKVSVTVTWQENMEQKTVEISSYLTRWR